MANTSLRREPFDRDRDFVVLRPLTLHGDDIAPGKPFPKERVTTRRLRQLYDNRQITHGELKPVRRRKRLDPSKMTDAQLFKFLEKNDIIPRASASRDKLLEKVNDLLSKVPNPVT